MMATTEEDAAIALVWPEKWARANSPALRGRSKARNNLRKQYRAWMARKAFMQANPTASCLNCRHRSPMPHDARYCCDLNTDFYGYAALTSNNPCVRWQLIAEAGRE